jgi:hypothetical protein
MKAIRIHLENLYSARIVDMHKNFDANDINIVFNSLESGYQAIIPLINLATQVIELNNVIRGNHAELEICFGRKLDGFLDTITNNISQIRGIGAVTI